MFRWNLKGVLCAVVATCLCPDRSGAQTKRPIEPADCVSVRYIYQEPGEPAFRINRQGNRVAYMVKAPNLETNENEILLYVRDFPGKPGEKSRLVQVNPVFSQMRWLEDGSHLALLMKREGRIVVASVDVLTGAVSTLFDAPSDIEEFDLTARADTLVYALSSEKDRAARHSLQEIQQGYRIPNQGNPAAAEVHQSMFRTKTVYLVHRNGNQTWNQPEAISIKHPLTGIRTSKLLCTDRFYLSLSPDGGKLLVTVAGIDLRGDLSTSSRPQAWRESSNVRARTALGMPMMLTVLEDLRSREASMPLASPYTAATIPLWSNDGESFALAAMSPVGSKWEHEDHSAGATTVYPFHLWRVSTRGDEIQQISPNLPNPSRCLLAYTGKRVVFRSKPGTVESKGLEEDGNWTTVSELKLPLEGVSTSDALGGDGERILAEYQNTATPPEIVFYDRKELSVQVLDRLNPQFDRLTLAPSRHISWKTSEGVEIQGLLFLPIHYQQGQRYPLVIQTKSSDGRFLCDGGADHPPSFAPQPLANADIAYLVYEGGDHRSSYPPGYPGGIGEAVFYTDVWDSAVSELSREGIIDENKVGIIGFSRTGWHVEFALMQGRTRYAAATAADNVQFSLGDYWVDHSDLYTHIGDAIYGGAPYGNSLQNWQEYSISFNFEKIHTPLLLEVMGYGVREDRTGATPFNLISRYEILTGLSRLQKPVELYYYPDEDHEPDHPQARLASIQRNVDWYRFWLQDYERPDQKDPDLYSRWKVLRSLRDADRSLSFGGRMQ